MVILKMRIFLLKSLNPTRFVVEFYSYIGHYAIHYVIVVQSVRVNSCTANECSLSEVRVLLD